MVYELDAYLKDMATKVTVPEQFGAVLMHHLIGAWGTLRKRTFRRVPTAGSLKVCVGLRSSHYFLSGAVDFTDQVSATDALLRREINPFLDPHRPGRGPDDPDDVWSGAFDLRVKIPENPNIEDPNRILLKKNTAQKEEAASAKRGCGPPPRLRHGPPQRRHRPP